REQQFVSRLNKCIESQIDNALFGVEELSRVMLMSRSQLYRKLKAITGKTPTDYLRHYRLHRAHQLLAHHTGTVNEIAYQVGFNSANYFFKCFKDEFGITPGELMRAGG
ncbi:MAG: helix-turn-helix transcriptional regulator, partial [Bacteroidota bacterium]